MILQEKTLFTVEVKSANPYNDFIMQKPTPSAVRYALGLVFGRPKFFTWKGNIFCFSLHNTPFSYLFTDWLLVAAFVKQNVLHLLDGTQKNQQTSYILYDKKFSFMKKSTSSSLHPHDIIINNFTMTRILALIFELIMIL